MSGPKVVLSNRSQNSSLARQIVILCLFILVAAGMYEFGLSRAGFSRTSAIETSARLEEDKQELLSKNKALREQVAMLETATKVDREAYGQVETQLIDLQRRILEQQEDIEFYKGIVNENDGTGLRIQNFKIARSFGERKFDLRLVLAQAFRSTKQVSGKVEMVVEGVQGGKSVRMSLQELAPDAGEAESDKSGRLNYSFRYFQDLKAEVLIPAGFEPERVHIIVHPKGKSSKTVEDFFVWDTKPG